MYITHSGLDSPYGAGSSLRAHLGILKRTTEVVFSCIQRETKVLHYLRRNKMHVHLDGLEKVYFAPFRYEFIWKGAPKTKLESLQPFFERYLDVMNFISAPFIWWAVYQERPRIIHLNSVTLLSLVLVLLPLKRLLRLKIVVHCRELVKDKTRSIHGLAAQHVDQWICIDSATEDCLRVRFRKHLRNPIKTIPNPIYFSKDEPLPEGLQWLQDNQSKIYLCAGQLSCEKGVDLIIESFIKASPKNSRLLLVGDFYDKVALDAFRRAISIAPDRVVHHSRIDNLAATPVYNYVHCLVRADSEFCSGRTTFEALLNGRLVIMHADKEYVQSEEGISSFSDQILFYEKLELVRLVSLMRQCSKMRPLMLTNEEKQKRYQQRNDTYRKECELIYKTLYS